jgi:phosphocarrier protein HPr
MADAAAEVTIVNRRGLHARAAARFVKAAEAFEAAVTVARDDASVSGTSILGLMMLGAGPGTSLRIAANGADAAAAVATLVALVAAGFEED